MRLKEAGVIDWKRRSKPGGGQFEWVQDTNAYFFNPPSKWIGYRMPIEVPAPDPDTWGATPPVIPPDWYEFDASPLAAALSKLGRSMRDSAECRDKSPHVDSIPAFVASG
jgi:hypothetical protein